MAPPNSPAFFVTSRNKNCGRYSLCRKCSPYGGFLNQQQRGTAHWGAARSLGRRGDGTSGGIPACPRRVSTPAGPWEPRCGWPPCHGLVDRRADSILRRRGPRRRETRSFRAACGRGPGTPKQSVRGVCGRGSGGPVPSPSCREKGRACSVSPWGPPSFLGHGGRNAPPGW